MMDMAGADIEEEILLRKKFLELSKLLSKKEKTPKEILMEKLVDRGDEVLKAAEEQFPEQTKIIVEKLAEMIKKGYITSNISGAQLLWLFRQLGLPIRIETKIMVEEKGKFIPLSEKLKREE